MKYEDAKAAHVQHLEEENAKLRRQLEKAEAEIERFKLQTYEMNKGLLELNNRAEKAEAELKTQSHAYEEIIRSQRDTIYLFMPNSKAATDKLNKRDIEQQIKGIESAYKNAPSKANYNLPVIDSTDLFDYIEQLRKEIEK